MKINIQRNVENVIFVIELKQKQMNLQEEIKDMIENHPHLKDDDNLLVANYYISRYPNRYAFNQFLYLYADGKIPTHTEIVNIKNQLIK